MFSKHALFWGGQKRKNMRIFWKSYGMLVESNALHLPQDLKDKYWGTLPEFNAAFPAGNKWDDVDDVQRG